MSARLLNILLLGAMGLLTACSSQPIKRTYNNHNTAAATTGYKNISAPADNYIARHADSLMGFTLASSNNTCVDHFNFLREAKSNQYKEYSKDYGDIGKGYRFLNTNKNIMDNDAKEVYTMMLEMKLDTLCSKIQYTGYSVIKAKMGELSHI
ncbi:hypothetical protein NTJ16_003385 [Yersinia ruckeri]|nr:hypothetical protein [Yersinia ruckeri]